MVANADNAKCSTAEHVGQHNGTPYDGALIAAEHDSS